jgi:glutamate/tyrosine decarboxylase-like PLP-dependent enzyme
MCSDLTLASVIAYFATLLYNPNNVSAEASPVTTRLELEVAAQLAAMIGFDPLAQWGHLTSGGTVANIEALWVARNLKYLPLAVRWACEALGEPAPAVTLTDGTRAVLSELDLWRLLNVRGGSALEASAALARRHAKDPAALRCILDHSLSGMGYQAFGLRLAREFHDALPAACVLVPATAHYSWEKACRALGIGASQLVHIPVDAHFRMNVGALEQRLTELSREHRPVLACVTVVGSTEEGAVDRVDRIAAAREQSRARGLDFWLHADAAWGGYAATLTWKPGHAGRVEAWSQPGEEATLSPDVLRGLTALERCDSVTIDPHKLGYVPYPAGAISFADRRVRELVAVDAPYVFQEGVPDAACLGRYLFEGSKPGAAAAGVWMSHRILPLDSGGHGRIVAQTVRSARALHRRLLDTDWGAFTVAPLPAPDLNLVCFGLAHPSLKSLEAVNAFVGQLHRALSATLGRPGRGLDYFVSETLLRAREYGDAALPLVQELGFDREDYLRAGGVAVVRCTVMNPFFSAEGEVDFLQGFIEGLRRAMEACTAPLALG